MQQRKVIPLQERLLAHTVATDSGCLEWNGAKTTFGYGLIGRGIRGSGIVRAHRAMWEIVYGTIPEGQIVRHKCDNPSCVNPKHLLLGTQKDNIQDAVSRNRTNIEPSLRILAEKQRWGAITCKKGHIKTGKNTMKGKPVSACLICKRERYRKTHPDAIPRKY